MNWIEEDRNEVAEWESSRAEQKKYHERIEMGRKALAYQLELSRQLQVATVKEKLWNAKPAALPWNS